MGWTSQHWSNPGSKSYFLTLKRLKLSPKWTRNIITARIGTHEQVANRWELTGRHPNFPVEKIQYIISAVTLFLQTLTVHQIYKLDRNKVKVIILKSLRQEKACFKWMKNVTGCRPKWNQIKSQAFNYSITYLFLYYPIKN